MCVFLCVRVYHGICLHLPSQIIPHKHTPNTNTHTHTFALKRKGSLDYVGSEGGTGEPNSSWNNRGAEQWNRGKLQEEMEREWGSTGVKYHSPLGEQSRCSLLVCCCNADSLTHIHSHWDTKQTRATADLTMPVSLVTNHSTQLVLSSGGNRETGSDG